MTRPLLLDLFCGAGGCSKGFTDAGFEVIGVDLEPQPNYPYHFIQADAVKFLEWLLTSRRDLIRLVAIAASPPCQAYSKHFKHLSGEAAMLIDVIRLLLEKTRLPWIIENVEGAPIAQQMDLFGAQGVMLCGSSFGSRVHRHRFFETNWPVVGLSCSHKTPTMNPHNAAGREAIYKEFGRGDPEIKWRKEMGVEWMTRAEGRQAIPPAFTEYLGRQLLSLR